MTPEIKRLLKRMKRRYDAYKKYKTPKNWRKYTALEDEIKQKVDASHKNYINGMFDVENGSKRLWKYVKSLKRDSMGIASLVSENQVVKAAKEKAEALSSQYSSVFTPEFPKAPCWDHSYSYCSPMILLLTSHRRSGCLRTTVSYTDTSSQRRMLHFSRRI